MADNVLLLVFVRATNVPLPKAILFQYDDDGSVLAVQVMPSGLVAACAVLAFNATKFPFPKASASQEPDAGNVLATQDNPSFELTAAAFVAAFDKFCHATITNKPFP